MRFTCSKQMPPVEGEAVRTVQILNVSAVEDLDLVEAMLMPNPAKGQVSLVLDDLQYAGAQVICMTSWEQKC